MITAAEVAARLETVQARCARAGASDITVVGVTKGHGPDAIRAAAGAGIEAIGESYAQELLRKHEQLAGDLPEGWPRVHFIGRVQRNKVRRLAGIVDVWQSVDRAELVDELAKWAPGVDIMVQMDVSGERAKGGCSPEDVAGLVQRSRDAGLDVRGLMAVGPMGDPEDARSGFRRLRSLVDELGLEACSMGMSADLEVAIEEGATVIRIGTDLFGPRPPRSPSGGRG